MSYYVIDIILQTLRVNYKSFYFFSCSTPVQYARLNICIKQLNFSSKEDMFIPQFNKGPNNLHDMSVDIL